MSKEDIFKIKTSDPSIMKAEGTRIFSVLETLSLSAETIEVGSSAIDEVIGKEDIDFLVRTVPDQFKKVCAILDDHFDRDVDQLSNEQYQAYKVPSDIDIDIDIALQVTPEGSPYDHFEAFLEILRQNRATRDSYNQLKRDYDGEPMSQYREAKAAFIMEQLGRLC